MKHLPFYGRMVSIYDSKTCKKLKNINDIIIDDIFFKSPYYTLCFEITHDIQNDFLYNDFNISYDIFPWKTYLKINNEIIPKKIKNDTDLKFIAWQHWKFNGIREERACSFINNTNIHCSRFGNLFFLNMALHFFSMKFNLKSSYKYEKLFTELGIVFYRGRNIYNKNLLLTDYNFVNLLKSNVSPKNIIINNDIWLHTNEFCRIIQNYFDKNKIFDIVQKMNVFKNRYGKNNDLFIHVRLGDVSHKTKKLSAYFENLLETIEYNRAYISSDDIESHFVIELCKKYNLIKFDEKEVKTIMFGSTCKYIVMSGGTFSWLIGFLAPTSPSNIYYPDIQDKWYGDIFSFSKWTKIDVIQ